MENFEKKTILETVQKNLTKFFVLLIAVALILNLGILTVLGSKGEEVTNIRNAQEKQKIANDLLRSELESLKVSSSIESKALNNLDMKVKKVNIIENTTTTTAEK